MHFSAKKMLWTVAAAFLIVAALAMFLKPNDPTLTLRDAESGKVYARYPLKETDTFSITFVHSVNQSPVTDYFRRGENNQLVCYATKFHAFGAGIPESWPEGAKVETSGDGIYVSNLHIIVPDVTYIVGTVSDHTLVIGDKTVSLRALCGQNAEVIFSLS